METDQGEGELNELDAEIPEGVVAALNRISISKDIDNFFCEIDAMVNTLPLTMVLLAVESKRAEDLLEKKYAQKKLRGPDGKSYIQYSNIDESNHNDFNKQLKRYEKARLAMRIVPQSFLVSLISQYDAFIGTIIRSFYYLKPELLSASGKQFTFAELQKIGSIEAASEYIIEKEVNAVMRGSHVEQIEWLSTFSGIDLKKELKSWKTFVEITQRRNLFVHTGGKISQQYLEECKKYGRDVSKLAKGQQLNASAKYFTKAYETVLEVGLIVAQAIWRKLLPSERKAADQNLNNICIELIVENRCRLACKILDHAIEEFKHHSSSEEYRLMMFVNRAQSYKWLGEDDKAKKMLASQDWSAKSIEFKLAVAVLMDDFTEAYRLMKIIGTTGTPSQEQYKEWPIFRNICKEQKFTEIYEEIFKAPYRSSEAKSMPDKSIFDIVDIQMSNEMFENQEEDA